ncbi:MAG: UDP-3-O-acyl-N-acetylglucosamine deacetylase [Bdellovibrionales bacterium CG10_big_fil_rev_8_21_14_0_10_45_34]|nr:MAG: UDP-3-O-acyl-N-acetylglucosamine deacetylase [Bdellovibrionales bacterium CG10_big_fil_rev_8_21_14_0_10_45_34]
MLFQRTLKKRVVVDGTGLHTGKPARLAFCPAPEDTGILFVRNDLPGQPLLPVLWDRVKATQQATTLGGDDFSVSTVEHCLSAVAALRIDNMLIELEGPEIPIVDGSAAPYLNALLSSGFYDQKKLRSYIYMTKPIEMTDGQKFARISPYNGLRVSCKIHFDHPCIGDQELDMDVNQVTFTREIAPARTFGFLKDVQELHRRGLALGGSLSNAIVLNEDSIINPEGLRFRDEFVRHKILDALGDLVTLGYPMLGHVHLERTGHDFMNRFIRKVVASRDSYRVINMGDRDIRVDAAVSEELRQNHILVGAQSGS